MILQTLLSVPRGMLLASLLLVATAETEENVTNSTSAATDATTTEPLEPSTQISNLCETDEKKKMIEEELNTYIKCHKPHPTDSRRLECGRLSEISVCLETYTHNVSDCFDKDTISHWETTVKMLPEAEKYLCDNDQEHRKEFYREGGNSCLNDAKVVKCGPNILKYLLHFNGTLTLHREALTLKYDEETCRSQDANITCLLNKMKGISKCKKSATVLEGLYNVVLNSTICNDAPSIFAPVLGWTVLASLAGQLWLSNTRFT